MVYEPPLRQLQQALSYVAPQSPPAPPRQPGVPSGAPLASRLVLEGLRLLPKVSGGTRQRTQAHNQINIGLSVFLTEIRVRSGPVL